MRLFSKISPAMIVLIFTGLFIAGCDDSPSSVEDFPIQGTMDSPGGVAVSSAVSPTFEVSYQGLKSSPSAEPTSGDISVEKVSEEGDPNEGGTTSWQVSLATDAIQSPIKEIGVVLKATGSSDNRTITDTVSAFATTKLSIESSFTSSFATVADYEGDVDASTYCGEDPDTAPYEGGERSMQTSGASAQVNANSDGNNTPQGSNGITRLGVTSEQGGSVTIRRRMNLPNSNQFVFLIRSNSNQRFTMTLGFTEVTDGTDGGSGAGTTTREFSLPVLPGVGWLKIGIPFSEISSDFNPVAPRSGGNGPLMSITLTTDDAASYEVDQMLFAKQGTGPRAEFHDFEKPPCAYGPPFSGGTFAFTSNVSAKSDGYTARTLDGIGFFGYNQPPLYLDVDGNDILSFLGKGLGTSRDLYVFLEGPGNFTGGNGMTKTLPDDKWQRFKIPLSNLGDDPSALIDGLGNVGFGGCDSCAVDDIKIMPKN